MASIKGYTDIAHMFANQLKAKVGNKMTKTECKNFCYEFFIAIAQETIPESFNPGVKVE